MPRKKIGSENVAPIILLGAEVESHLKRFLHETAPFYESATFFFIPSSRKRKFLFRNVTGQ